jgi:hypothetical protein
METAPSGTFFGVFVVFRRNCLLVCAGIDVLDKQQAVLCLVDFSASEKSFFFFFFFFFSSFFSFLGVVLHSPVPLHVSVWNDLLSGVFYVGLV